MGELMQEQLKSVIYERKQLVSIKILYIGLCNYGLCVLTFIEPMTQSL